MRGFAISFLTLARVESLGFFLPLYDMLDDDTQGNAMQFHFAQLRCCLVRSSGLFFQGVLNETSFDLHQAQSRAYRDSIFRFMNRGLED